MKSFKIITLNGNRLLSIIILIAIAGGIGFWILWAIVLNKGTVVFVFDRPPYAVKIAEEQKTCLATECEFNLPTGPRNYSVTKDGYYEAAGSVNVARDKKTTLDINLQYIPQAAEGAEYKTFQLPAGYSKFLESLNDISLYAEFPEGLELKGLPKILNNVMFAESGKKALVFEENKVSVYSTEDFSVKKLDDIKDATEAVFSEDENIVYAVSYDESAKKYALKKVWLNAENPAESLVYFGRDIMKCELSVSDSAGQVALSDKTFSPEILYIIDLNQKSRTNVFEGYVIENGDWSQSGDVFVFKAKGMNENYSSVYVYNSSDKSVQKLKADMGIKNISFLNGDAVFATSQKYFITNYSVPYTIEFESAAAPSTIEELANAEGDGKQMILAKWNIAENKFYLIKDLSGIIQSVPKKIELSSDGKTVRMLIDGEIFDIKISE